MISHDSAAETGPCDSLTAIGFLSVQYSLLTTFYWTLAKRTYIKFERGGFGPFRGPDGRFPEWLAQTPAPSMGAQPPSNEEPEREPVTSISPTAPMVIQPVCSANHSTAGQPHGGTSPLPGSDDGENPESAPEHTPQPHNSGKPAAKEGKRTRQTHGSVVSEAELARMIANIPDKNDDCFRQKAAAVYLPRHASYTYILHGLAGEGYTHQQILWLFGADPTPMASNVVWMRLKRYRTKTGCLG